MDLEHAKTILDTLYGDIDGYEISNIGRRSGEYPEKSFVYGEVAAESFYRIISRLKPREGAVFYDLGAGTGKAVVLAHLLFPFRRSIGIEIVPTLYESAQGVLYRYRSEIEPHLGSRPGSIEFLLGDVMEKDFSDGDVVFMHSTCFEGGMMQRLQERLKALKPGSRIVTVTKDLQGPEFTLVEHREYNMNWGQTTIYVYTRA